MKIYLATLLLAMSACAEAATYFEYKVCTSIPVKEGKVTYEVFIHEAALPEDMAAYNGVLTDANGKVGKWGRHAVRISGGQVVFKQDNIRISLPKAAFRCTTEIRDY